MSVPGRIRLGLFPPSSSTILLRFLDAWRITLLPTPVEPVNVTMSTFALSVRRRPTSCSPQRKDTAPGGRSASQSRRIHASDDKAALGEGSNRAVDPDARAPPIFQAAV